MFYVLIFLTFKVSFSLRCIAIIVTLPIRLPQSGESVLEGQDICIVEAMKMQNVIRSPCAGVIKTLHADVGSSLMADETIVEFEKNDTD